MRWSLAAFCLLGVAMLLGSASPAKAVGYGIGPGRGFDCGRDCLNGIVDQFLASLVAHDPSKAPLAKNVKFTEDGVQLEPGDGLWATASGVGSYKLYFAEPSAGSAGIYALVQENGAALSRRINSHLSHTSVPVDADSV